MMIGATRKQIAFLKSLNAKNNNPLSDEQISHFTYCKKLTSQAIGTFLNGKIPGEPEFWPHEGMLDAEVAEYGL